MELTIDQALRKGVEAHKAGQVQEADRLYTAILKAQPKHPDANHNMGVLAVGVDKVFEALPFFKTALEENPNIDQFWLSYIDALIRLDRMEDAKAAFAQAKCKDAKGDGFDKLETVLMPNTKLDNVISKNSLLDAAIELREGGKYFEAIHMLKDEIRKFPKDPNLLSLISNCYILNDDLKEAGIYLNKAKKIDASIAWVGWNEARLLMKKQNIIKGLAVAKKTSRRFPDDVEGMGVLGSCLTVNGDMDEGLKVLDKAIALNPNYAEALINRSLIWLKQEKKSRALTDLKKAHEIKPHLKQIWDLLISLTIEAKNYSSAITILINMIEVDPNHEKSFALLSACNQKSGNTALAIKSFERALEVKPGNVSMHLNLGMALNRQGESEKAIAQFKKALSTKPNFAEAYFNMGNAFKDQGKIEKAIDAYNKALEIKPDYAEVYNNMGIAFRDKGKLEEAVDAYNKALTIKPEYDEAFSNMGNSLMAGEKWDAAIESYESAEKIKPESPDTLQKLSIAKGRAVPSWHIPMMNESTRNEAYQKALTSAINGGEIVLDIGTGAGLLSMMASDCGAKKVITCETSNTISKVAEKIFLKNGFANKIKLINKNSNDIIVGKDINEKVDVLVSEILSSEFVGEGIQTSILDAKKRLLKKNGKIIPEQGSIMIALIESTGKLSQELFVDKSAGYDISDFNALAKTKHLITLEDEPVFLSNPFDAFSFDFRNFENIHVEEKTIKLTVNKSGLCAGIIQWIKVGLYNEIEYQNHPIAMYRSNSVSGWKTPIFKFENPIELKKGQVLEVTAVLKEDSSWFYISRL